MWRVPIWNWLSIQILSRLNEVYHAFCCAYNLPFLSQLAPWTLIFWPPFFECISFEYAWLFLNQWTCSLCLLIFSKRVVLLWYLRYFNTYLCQIVNHSFFANLNLSGLTKGLHISFYLSFINAFLINGLANCAEDEFLKIFFLPYLPFFLVPMQKWLSLMLAKN